MKKTYLTLLMAGTLAIGFTPIPSQAGTLGINTGVNADVNTGAVNARVNSNTNADARTYNRMETSAGSPHYKNTNELNGDTRTRNRVDSNTDFSSDLEIETNANANLGTDSGFEIYTFND